jgi:hypothetical protein
MQFIDDRTPEEKISHSVLITARDIFLSSWGPKENHPSRCAWACKPEHADQVYKWVSSREDMRYVNYVSASWRPKGKGHTHVYVVNDNHPALKG